jgi:hypothetical protein
LVAIPNLSEFLPCFAREEWQKPQGDASAYGALISVGVDVLAAAPGPDRAPVCELIET